MASFHFLACLTMTGLSAVADPVTSWPQFRGPNSQGVAVDARLPFKIAPEEAVWKVAVPEGHSSPVVWGQRLFLTGVVDGRIQLRCLDAMTGASRWQAEVPGALSTEIHRTSSYAAATPATDGERVYGYFPSFGLLAWDMDGREVWRRPLDVPFVVNGSGTSPVLAGGKLIVCLDQQGGQSSLLAVDPVDGRTLWQTPRPSAVSNYTTPVVWSRGPRVELVVSGNLQAAGYNLADGAERWTVAGLEAVSVCPTPVIGEAAVYFMSRSLGGGGAMPPQMEKLLWGGDADRDGKLTLSESGPLQKDGGFDFVDRNRDGAVTPEELGTAAAYLRRAEYGVFALGDPGDQTGDVTGTHVQWRHQKGVAKVTSPVLLDGRLVVVQDGGMVTATEADTGRIVFERERLGADGGGDYFASPITDGMQVCFCSLRGVVTIAGAGEAFSVLRQVKLGETISATPALVGPRLYVRSTGSLWLFSE